MILLGEKFDIVVSRWKDSRKFKMNVECIYISEQVIRFKITAGQKVMLMEKILIKKTSQWKITKINFQFEGDNESVAMAIMKIQNEIEYYLDPPRPRSWYKP